MSWPSGQGHLPELATGAGPTQLPGFKVSPSFDNSTSVLTAQHLKDIGSLKSRREGGFQTEYGTKQQILMSPGRYLELQLLKLQP